MANSPAEQYLVNAAPGGGAGKGERRKNDRVHHKAGDQIDRDHGHAPDRRGHALRCQRIPATPEMEGCALVKSLIWTVERVRRS